MFPIPLEIASDAVVVNVLPAAECIDVRGNGAQIEMLFSPSDDLVVKWDQ